MWKGADGNYYEQAMLNLVVSHVNRKKPVAITKDAVYLGYATIVLKEIYQYVWIIQLYA